MSNINQETWRERAINRRDEIKALKKRIKEIKRSRNHWKDKYLSIKGEKEFYENELQKIKKKLNEIINK
jgi:hypothetical protein